MATLASGIITLAWHDYKDWEKLRYILTATNGPTFINAVAAVQIFGGAAIQFGRSAKMGAILLTVLYFFFALLCVPPIVVTPQVYDRWGNFFEQSSLATGAAIVYARLSSACASKTVGRIAGILLGICAGSFALEKGIYLDATAGLVPKWLPPSQMFWAVATTVPFALAAIALIANRMPFWRLGFWQ